MTARAAPAASWASRFSRALRNAGLVQVLASSKRRDWPCLASLVSPLAFSAQDAYKVLTSRTSRLRTKLARGVAYGRERGDGRAVSGAVASLCHGDEQREAGLRPHPPVRCGVHRAVRGLHGAAGHARLRARLRRRTQVRGGLRLGRGGLEHGVCLDGTHRGDRPEILRGSRHPHPGRHRVPVPGARHGRVVDAGRRVRPAHRRPDRLPPQRLAPPRVGRRRAARAARTRIATTSRSCAAAWP